MNLPAGNTSVLIVGAGPSGLMMAAQLLRNGVQPVIIDSKQGPTNQSKALAVQARSLEIYRQMGLETAIVNDGLHAQGIRFFNNGSEVASLSLGEIANRKTAFPYIQIYQQHKNERLLLDYLTLHCCPVYWNTTLTSIEQKEGKVLALLSSGGLSETLTCDWLVAADGAGSTVRKQLNIPFKGDTYEYRFYLADVVLDIQDEHFIQTHLADAGFVAFFPLPEIGHYRIVGSLPKGLDDDEEFTIDNVIPFIKATIKNGPCINECTWFSTYKLHHRMAENFRMGNCFLIGDAAHIHSPVGGQGMNTGLQDAHNLAWKLAGVVNGQYSSLLLDSYVIERMPVAARLLKTTDRAFQLIISHSLVANLFKKWVLPTLLKKLWGNLNSKEHFFEVISQTGIEYRHSKFNLHLSQKTNIKAGDRLPYLKIYDEKKQTETDLHQWCTKPGFTIIALGTIDEPELFRLARWLNQAYPQGLNFFYLPPSQKNRPVFDAFEITADQRKTLIVRPDMHIGLINDGLDLAIIDNYLKNIVGMS